MSNILEYLGIDNSNNLCFKSKGWYIEIERYEHAEFYRGFFENSSGVTYSFLCNYKENVLYLFSGDNVHGDKANTNLAIRKYDASVYIPKIIPKYLIKEICSIVKDIDSYIKQNKYYRVGSGYRMERIETN